MKNCILIMIGGGIGAVLRHLVTLLLNRHGKMEYWATFWVNISGCFCIGILGEVLVNIYSPLFAFFVMGLIGSYTTFSTFEYENIKLIAKEKYSEFLKYSVSSCLFGIIAVASGFYLASKLGL